MARSFPSMLEYQEAMQNPQAAFLDPELKGGTVVLDALGLPKPITGGFASVYQVKTKTKHFAVRCFLRPPAHVAERYSKISAFVKKNRPPWMAGFEFIEQGIRVHGKWYPVLKMEWVQGEPLNLYVAGLVGQKKPLLKLADQFTDLLKDMKKLKLAHGDLQHGNILVAQGKLFLIDYDAMFIDGMNGVSAEVGHRNFQHPRRSVRDFGLYLDHFSAWVILISLRALAVEPKLWIKLDGGDEGLLFRKEDFLEPGKSKAFTEIEQLKNTDITKDLNIFRQHLAVSCQDVPSPLDILAKAPTATPQGKTGQSNHFSLPTTSLSQISRLMLKKPVLSRGQKKSKKSHSPQSVPQQLLKTPLFDRLWIVVSIVSLLWIGFSILDKVITMDLALFLSSSVLLATLMILWARYLMLPLVRQKRRLLEDLQDTDAELESCRASLLGLTYLEKEIQGTHKLNTRKIQEHLKDPEGAALLEQLEDFLQKMSWTPGKIPGIEDSLCQSLRKQGLKSALHFEDMIVTRSMAQGETEEKISLLLTNGRSIQDPRLDRKTAPVIFAWRRQGELKFVIDKKVEFQILQVDLEKKKHQLEKDWEELSWVNAPHYLSSIFGLR